MELLDYYRLYPTQKDCIQYLEDIIWYGSPICPYCNSKYSTQLTNEARRHCNTCNTSFSITVNTIFHKSKVDLQKWFFAIWLVLKAGKRLSARQMAHEIQVTKDTALFMLNRIRKGFVENADLLNGISDMTNGIQK